jgi:hypothetical protein
MRYDVWNAAVTTVMVLLGTAMTLYPPTKRPWKMAYVAAFILFGVANIALVTAQSNDTERAERTADKARASLQMTMDDLRRASLEIERAGRETARIQALNTQLQERLLAQGATITTLSRTAINVATGGDSYCYLELLRNTIDDTGGMPIVIHMGKYPLRDVEAEVVDVPVWLERVKDNTIQSALHAEATLNVGNIGPTTSKLMYTAKVPFRAVPEQIFLIRFSSQNGFWNERLRAQKVDGLWVFALRVERVDGKHVLYEKVDPKYPRTNGRINWD